MAKPEIRDAIIGIHNPLGYGGQDPTIKAVYNIYYGATWEKVIFRIKLYEICHRKTYSIYKGPWKPIISTAIFERVQIDLIDI